MNAISIIERVKMEIRGCEELTDQQLSIYIVENGLDPTGEYNPESMNEKKSIYAVALNVLESVASDITLMKRIKLDDMEVSDFHENLLSRIVTLEKKLRQMKSENNQSDIFMLFQ